MVRVKLADGVRWATLVPGTVFGEMALFEGHRTADVWADTPVCCIQLTLERFDGFRERHPQVGDLIMRNLAGLLVRRLGRANTPLKFLRSAWMPGDRRGRPSPPVGCTRA